MLISLNPEKLMGFHFCLVVGQEIILAILRVIQSHQFIKCILKYNFRVVLDLQ